MSKTGPSSLKVVYANWLEHPANQRFLEALAENFDLTAFSFDETGTEVIRQKAPQIQVPAKAHKVKIKDPPLIKLPLSFQMSSKGGNAGWLLKAFTRAMLFRSYINNASPGVVIGSGVSGTNPYGLAAAFSDYHPFLLLVWGSDVLIEAKRSRILRLVARFILSRADGVIVDSQVKAEAVRALGYTGPIWSFPWGIDLTLFNARADGSKLRRQLNWEDKVVIVSTRNHFPVYGVENLIRAIPLAVKECPNVRFLIVGKGKLTGSLVKLADTLGVTEYVYFAGAVPNNELPKFLRAAQLYVSTSYSDGTSASLLEAMACGLPIIVTDIPANRDWVKNNQNGLLTPIKSPQKLAQQITYLVENTGIRKEMGNNNLIIAQNKADWKKNQRILCNAVKTLSG